MIKTELLTKRYGDFLALSDVSLRVNQGEIYGFLGPNGAGKTTTMMILLGLVRPTSGKVYLFGNQLRYRDPLLFTKIGIMEEDQHFYDDMTAKDYLLFFAQLVGVRSTKNRVIKCLEEVGLVDVMERTVGAFSRCAKS
jgi:ABC-type multidrug transport system ATPase subunit